jgi:hypothetical protein
LWWWRFKKLGFDRFVLFLCGLLCKLGSSIALFCGGGGVFGSLVLTDLCYFTTPKCSCGSASAVALFFFPLPFKKTTASLILPPKHFFTATLALYSAAFVFCFWSLDVVVL